MKCQIKHADRVYGSKGIYFALSGSMTQTCPQKQLWVNFSQKTLFSNFVYL